MLTRFVRVPHDGGARVGLLDADGHVDLFDHDEPLRAIRGDGEVVERLDRVDVRLLPPIEAPEIWCAGVTYERSRDARVEESRTDARDVYALVYDADRPELFMKDAQMRRTVGPGGPDPRAARLSASRARPATSSSPARPRLPGCAARRTSSLPGRSATTRFPPARCCSREQALCRRMSMALEPGHTVSIEIPGIGELVNTVVPW